MSLSRISIFKPVFAWMLMIALMLFGFFSLRKMGLSQLPDVDFPTVNIQVTYEGAAPEIMEVDVIDPIESSVLAVEGVKKINSTARLGSANISVEFNLEKNIDTAVAEIESKLNQTARLLPKNIDPPVISKINPDDRPIMWLSVTSTKMKPKELMSFVRDQLKDKFQTLPGVADVFLGGYVDPNLRVWVERNELDKNDLTVTDVINAIQSEHKESPSGFIENNLTEKNIRTLGEATDVEDFKKLPIIRRGGTANFKPIYVGDVAKVEDGLADVRRISRAKGINAVGLGIRKQRGSNAVGVAKEVKKKIELLNEDLPEGLEIGVNFDSTTFIEESIEELGFNMILSSLLTAFVCWLFLGSISSTINVVLAIPTSILGSFIILKWMNFTLNTFTLLGLSLSIGIVVDDAIMVLENIFRHFEMGKNKKDASLDGAEEISFAALSATVAIMAIFVPVALMDGLIGKYFFQFGVTISVAVAISYLEAMTLTPMRTSQFMAKHDRSKGFGAWVERSFDKLDQFYEKILGKALNYRWTVLIVSTIFFVASFMVVKFVKKEFVPAQDTSSFLIRLKTKDGSSLAFTSEAMKDVENYFLSRKEVKRFFVSVGGFGTQGSESNSANMFVTLLPPKERPEKKSLQLLLNEYRDHFKSNFKKGIVFIQDTSQGGFSAGGRGFPIEFSVTGGDWKTLISSAKKIMQEMEKSGFYTDIDTNFKESVTELQIFPHREAAKLRGVSIQEIGSTINSLVGGVVVGKFTQNGHRNDIRVKLLSLSNDPIGELKKIKVRNTRGELIPLGDVVVIKELPGVQSISREQRQRAIAIFAGVAPAKSQADALANVQTIAKNVLPPGYQYLASGSSESFKESFQSLVFALVFGIVIAYMVLGSQFNSFIDPVTVLLALPFSFSGAFLALYFSGSSLNIYSAIGLILLMGIVKKNSILLVDFTNQLKSQGYPLRRAILEACPKRLRPILMTTFSTVAGALPLALSLGPGSENLKSMSIALIGGSIVSTVLTLVVVPVFYDVVSKEKNAQS